MTKIIFDFNFDNWQAALLSFVPALINLYILIYVSSFAKKSFSSTVFLFMVFFFLMWQMEETMMRLSHTEAMAKAWSKFFALGTQMVAAFGLHYVLLFTNTFKWNSRVVFIYLIYLPSFIFARLYIGDFANYTFYYLNHIGWIYKPNDTLSTINALWIGALSFTSAGILIYHTVIEKNRDSIYFKQLRILTIGVCFPAVIGVFSEVVLPNFSSALRMPVASSLSITFSVAIYIILTRYNFLAYSPRFVLSGIIENGNDGILIVDNAGTIQYVNNKICEITGYTDTELLGNKAIEIFLDDIKDIEKVNKATIDRDKKNSSKYELNLRAKNHSLVSVEITGFPYVDQGGNVIGSIGIHKDITEIKKTVTNLQLQEERWKVAIEGSNDSIWDWNINTNEVYRSSRWLEILGYSPNEIQNSISDWENRVYPNDLPSVKNQIKKHFNKETSIYRSEHRVRCKDGNYKWILDRGKVISWNEDGTPARMVGTKTDITENKLSENKLTRSENQIRNFASDLNKILEDERANIAREIHDELGQQLVGIKFGLSFIKKRHENDIEVGEKINEMMKDVDATLQSMRKIATELRPGILDSLGLIPSIHWLVGQFEKKTGIACILDPEMDQRKYEKNISICFFRICQEALTNISKHANATEVVVSIKLRKNKLIMIISDNGKGITNEKLKDPFSSGLLGIRERAKLIGAYLKIESKKDIGTTIIVSTKTNLDV